MKVITQCISSHIDKRIRRKKNLRFFLDVNNSDSKVFSANNRKLKCGSSWLVNKSHSYRPCLYYSWVDNEFQITTIDQEFNDNVKSLLWCDQQQSMWELREIASSVRLSLLEIKRKTRQIFSDDRFDKECANFLGIFSLFRFSFLQRCFLLLPSFMIIFGEKNQNISLY